ncbi:DNA-protecting protein DprA [Alginatibacterium sediminis]|uniref:DNA-protecting protein DprA n=1 Tax=Alginatibacterium sediminis TaxID=2164068 RepID=A0A420ENA2_9ALTE|nr:DNA-processing protein DprA [Alginatibacterium sediminis]RKF22197.1 DNA-protecting protein DprA [Alginatibacterium sediminis]
MALANLELWLRIDAVARLGVTQLTALIEKTGNIAALYDCSDQQLTAFGLSAKQITSLRQPNTKRIDRVLRWLYNPRHHCISYFCPTYPEQLRHIDKPPLLLFVKGNLSCLQGTQVAIVGSRNASYSSQQHAYCFAHYLARSLTITSGLAIGIDAKAHQGALSQSKGLTLAVLASGCDIIYPKQHHDLAEHICEHGALVSEFRPGTPPKAGFFPRRNRIISGLSQGVIMIEAGLPSGTMITAKYALEQGREVWALPGEISNPNTKGCHHLIRDGATLVTEPQQILEDLSLCPHISTKNEKNAPSCVNHAQQKLPFNPMLDNVDYAVTPIDVIAIRSQHPIAEVLTQLVELELAGLIQAVPGGYIRR